MNSKRHLYFRWTPRTAGISLMYIVVVPSIIGYVAYKTDVSGMTPGDRHFWGLGNMGANVDQGLIDFQAKRRGDTFLER